MSVKLTFVSPADGGRITRSRSFAGFSSTQSRMLAKSLGKGSTRSKMSVKSAKMYSSLQKGAVVCDPKPQQVKKIFEALKKGLNEYLEMHQTELDYLSECHRDRRRNSRLGFYYDLDKQIRSVERYIRKLEFQISKVEELYEAYSIQCRLRDGASNMKHAFSLSPSTKASRESLVELYKNLQECTEDMCLIEGTLEVHLGEFHLKMKGLVGYARLCPGDQYEVFIRLGRQKWKIKGKILTDDSQTWDEEEKVFIPSLHENFEIKVTELRGLSTILVGIVTCDSIDFFTTRPQTIIVDITELGTIKLQLEVLWNPFDSENLILSPGSTTKFSVGSRKNSIYSWTPPNTPSFREKYYLKLVKPNLAPIIRENLLKEVSQQKHVLEIISALATPVPRKITSVEEIIQKAKKQKHCLKIWSECTEQGSILFCPAERFWTPLKYILMFKTKEKYRHHLEKVLQVFLEQIVGGILLGNSRDLPAESVTLFQFYSYLEKHHINNLEKYLIRFAKEVILTEDLQRPGRMKKIKKLKGKQLNQLEPLPQTLRLLAVLQLDENHRIGKAATLCLSRAAANRNFRQKALPFYTDLLSNNDAKLQQAACLALKNLRGIESLEQIATLCQSETEEVRTTARETTLSFGEKGRLAFEKMDKICCELREAIYQEAEIEITIF
ncbi:RIPOR family member 3 isoform X2 [Pantherophis guttatus]|uniref:RIPOR family member 3 isoform X2 n=1 Tax=Pantherophis guttatus TaxID=94885 RepID=A0A6P9BEK3_PANGU|nr:RIPOR family member 3 isoform X2 [Pantherophis guttatus]